MEAQVFPQVLLTSMTRLWVEVQSRTDLVKTRPEFPIVAKNCFFIVFMTLLLWHDIDIIMTLLTDRLSDHGLLVLDLFSQRMIPWLGGSVGSVKQSGSPGWFIIFSPSVINTQYEYWLSSLLSETCYHHYYVCMETNKTQCCPHCLTL